MRMILITAITLLGSSVLHAAPLALQSFTGQSLTSQTVTPTAIQSSPAVFLKAAVNKESFKKPSKGMSMRKVERLFGEPLQIMPSTGKPPITRWIYNSFTVYFEGKYVIHAVRNRQFSPTT